MNTKVMARLLTSDYSRTEKLPKETSHIKAEMTSALCHLLYTYYSRGKKKKILFTSSEFHQRKTSLFRDNW